MIILELLNNLNSKKIFKIVGPILGVILAFIVAGLVVWASDGNPFEAYKALAEGAFGSAAGIKNTVRYTLPIIFLGFSFSICAKCGYFNIGQEGQLYMSALAIAAVQVLFPEAKSISLLLLMLAAAIVAGGVCCLIPAVFKFIFGVNEIIVAMLMNYIIVLLTQYLLMYSSLAEVGKSTAMSITIVPSTIGVVIFIVSVAIIIIYSILMKRSVPGYRLRMVGENRHFAKASGIKTIRLVLIVSFLGGAFSALSASGEIFGIYHKVYNGFAENLGFYGMTAALIGSQSAVGLVCGFSIIILGALQSGSINLSVMTDVPSEMVLVVQGFVMLFATVNVLLMFSGKIKGIFQFRKAA